MSIVNLQPESSAAFLASWKELTEAPITVMERQTIFLGMGSNVGDRKAMLQKALDAVAALPQTEVVRCSGIYETAPWGDVPQGPFYNCAVEIRSGLQPAELLAAIKGIEQDMGRERTERNGPRIIDIDILLFGDRVLKEEGLSIPHGAIADRMFVLIPLSEIAASVIHPIEKRTIREIAQSCSDTGHVTDTGLRLTRARP
ncbi:MAG: 2-amino-4-hydroxy-6-hydroxymethyldihydropteridine diphosphokinase [Bacteroidota bacterium]